MRNKSIHLEYACELSRIMHESHAYGLKTLISIKGNFLTLSQHTKMSPMK